MFLKAVIRGTTRLLVGLIIRMRRLGKIVVKPLQKDLRL